MPESNVMQIEVLAVGCGNAPAPRPAQMCTEHPLSVYGCPVVIVDGRARLPIDAVLEGWYVLTRDRDDVEAVQRWRAAVARRGGALCRRFKGPPPRARQCRERSESAPRGEPDMQVKVAIVGHFALPFAHLAVLTTEHVYCTFGTPVVLLEGRAFLPVDAALEGWHVLATDQAGEQALKSWDREVARYNRFHRDRPLRLGPVPAQPAARP